MKGTIFLTVSALVYTVATTYLFFKKDTINKLENRIFKKLLIMTIFSMVFELMIIPANDIPGLNTLIPRFFFVCILLWLAIFFMYSFAITAFDESKSEEENIKKHQPAHIVFMIINLVLIILVFILPMKFVNDAENKFINGPATNVLFVTLAVYLIFMISLVLTHIKKIHKKGYIPIIALIILLIIEGIVQNMHPEMLLANFVFGFIVYLMYHTIENPDIKILEELYKNKKIIENSNQDTSNFLFKISQDMKQPVNNIIEISSNSNDDKLKRINLLGKNLYYITHDVLDVSSLSENYIKVYNTKYNPRNLFKEIINKCSQDLQSDITIEYNINTDIPEYVYGDSIKLKQALSSILQNSIEHTISGIITLEINTIIKYGVCRFIIDITDNGGGLPIDKINDILSLEEYDKELNLDKKFLDLKETKILINKLGGSFMIKSEDTKTIVSIMIDQKMVDNDNTHNIKSIELYEQSINKNKKIMVVDDDLKELSNIRNILKSEDRDISISLYGNDLLEKVNDGYKFDLIILDDMANNYSAYEILLKLKKRNKFDTPVIIIIEKNKKLIKEHFIADGFADVIEKDNLVEDLKRVVSEYL